MSLNVIALRPSVPKLTPNSALKRGKKKEKEIGKGRKERGKGGGTWNNRERISTKGLMTVVSSLSSLPLLSLFLPTSNLPLLQCLKYIFSFLGK